MSEPADDPTIGIDRVSEILRDAVSDADKLRRIQRLVDEALAPPPAPIERDPGGWPKLRAARRMTDSGTLFVDVYDPRD